MGKPTDISDLVNGLSLRTTTALSVVRDKFPADINPALAAIIACDAALMAAVSLIATARLAQTIEVQDADAFLRERLNYILKLDFVFHQTRPDGSLDPVGQRLN